MIMEGAGRTSPLVFRDEIPGLAATGTDTPKGVDLLDREYPG